VPSEITQVEKRAVKDSAYRAKASEVHLVEERWPRDRRACHHRTVRQHDRGHGGGTTTSPSFSLAASSTAKRCASRQRDGRGEIIQYVKKQYNLLIGERTAGSHQD